MPLLYLRLSVSPTFIAIDAALTICMLPSMSAPSVFSLAFVLPSCCSVVCCPLLGRSVDQPERDFFWACCPSGRYPNATLALLLPSLFCVLPLCLCQSPTLSSNPCPLCGHSTPHLCYCWPCPLSRPFPTVLPGTLVPPIIQLTPPHRVPIIHC